MSWFTGAQRFVRRSPALACVSAFAVLALFAYSLPLLVFARGMLRDELWPVVMDRDFANYWMAARLVLAGEHYDLFIQSTYVERLREVFGADTVWRNWGYPPHFLLLIWPFGLFGYRLAMALFLLSTFMIFCWAVVMFRRAYAPRSSILILTLAVTGYVVTMVDAAQNGFLTGALLLIGLARMNDRQVLAGIAFGLLTIKPQLGFLVPVLLIAERNWPVVAWAAVTAAIVILLSVLFFGWQSWQMYITSTLEYQRSVMLEGTGMFLTMMPTVFGSLRTLGVASETALLVQYPVAAIVLLAAARSFRTSIDPLHKAYALTCATFLISPYAFNYDMGALTVAAGVLAATRSVGDGAALVAVSLSAGICGGVVNLARAGIPVTPLVLMLAFAVVVARQQRS